MQRLADAGVDRITVPLDAATEKLFGKTKGRPVGGPYLWEEQREVLVKAVEIMGRGRVGTHLIVGLGENESDVVKTVQWCVDVGVYPGLFAFTPIEGTALETRPQPSLSSYRRLQLAHYLITHRKTRFEKMNFDASGRLLDFGVSEKQLTQVVRTGSPFVTSGCPGCNRPYYNEKPGGPIYNYPRPPLPVEIAQIEKELGTL